MPGGGALAALQRFVRKPREQAAACELCAAPLPPVVLEEDPGRDLGMMRQPGHRFFFSPEEVEPVMLDEKDSA